ncbi:hypothetical protein [Streptomyces sp. NPDC058773]
MLETHLPRCEWTSDDNHRNAARARAGCAADELVTAAGGLLAVA